VNWNPIRKQALTAAEALGHKLGPFDTKTTRGMTRDRFGNVARMASCETCGGCCWIAFQPGRGFGAGGRLLKYKCGTPEAAGFIRAS
jgi:hypothetical protein